jgi:hypothetical protein
MAVVDENPDVRAGGELDTAALFALVWDAVAEVLGTAATAAIFRRAAGLAAADNPELVDVVIRREKLEYRYGLPHAWSQPATPEERAPIAFRALIAQIGRLLVDLTGSVFIGRLEQLPELRACGLVWRAKETN